MITFGANNFNTISSGNFYQVRSRTLSQPQMPTEKRNYCIFDEGEINFWVRGRENSIPYLNSILKNSNDEKEVVKVLYILNRMLDDGVCGIDKMYPTLSKFNDTQSPNIQTFLAGIYRKTQVPDAFGPLVRMLIQNSIRGRSNPYFDENEEIGGAILSYICEKFRNKTYGG